MKLAAVAQRGIYRDFWDLHELLSGGLSLQRALRDYATRYGAARSDLDHLLRALTYFDDGRRRPRALLNALRTVPGLAGIVDVESPSGLATWVVWRQP